MSTVNIQINGQKIAIEQGKTILQAAIQEGINIPNLCYNEKLSPFGACRLCMVEIIKGTKSRLVASCAYPVEEGMVVETKTPKVLKIRKLMVEMMLPLAPYNKIIKKLAEEYGLKTSRFPKKVDSCILCGQCVRYSSEVEKRENIGFAGRGTERHVSWTPKSEDELFETSAESVKICPTDVYRTKEASQKEELFISGHRLCAGCGAAITVRQMMLATKHPVVVANATGCLYVASATYPYTAWKTNWIHSAFENASATVSGIEAAYRSLRKQGKVKKEMKFIAIGGDGGTYDIGLQSLSGALERGHNFLYVCYNNEAYMNTGIQRSGATPMGASTTTSPAGTSSYGKNVFKKDLTGIIAAHNIPYVAQTTPAHYEDLMMKVEKALAVEGPSFINVLAPCHRGWRIEMKDSMKVAKLAVDTCYWPLFEIVNGNWKINYRPKVKKPIIELLKPQGRFKHLFTNPEYKAVIDRIQAEVDLEWANLQKRCLPECHTGAPLPALAAVNE